MGVYDSQIALAERLIREKGKPVTIIRQTTVTDPAKPWEPGVPTEEQDEAYGVFLNFNQNDMETYGKMPGASEIQASDRKVLLAAAAVNVPPTPNAKLRDETGDWSIEWVRALAPNGDNILFTLRVRK